MEVCSVHVVIRSQRVVVSSTTMHPLFTLLPLPPHIRTPTTLLYAVLLTSTSIHTLAHKSPNHQITSPHHTSRPELPENYQPIVTPDVHDMLAMAGDDVMDVQDSARRSSSRAGAGAGAGAKPKSKSKSKAARTSSSADSDSMGGGQVLVSALVLSRRREAKRRVETYSGS